MNVFNNTDYCIKIEFINSRNYTNNTFITCMHIYRSHICANPAMALEEDEHPLYNKCICTENSEDSCLHQALADGDVRLVIHRIRKIMDVIIVNCYSQNTK